MIDGMNWMTALVMTVALGCGSKKEEPKVEEEKKEESGWGSKLSGLADKAKDIGSEVGDKAKSIGNDVGDKAKEIGSEVGDKAKEVASGAEAKARELEIEKHAREFGDAVSRRANGVSEHALDLGRQLKASMDAARAVAKFNYDLSIDSADTEFAEKVGKMKQLAVGDYKVGYERRAQHPLGKVYKWQFMFGWKMIDGRSVRLSIFTDQELEEVMLAAMLGELIPLSTSMIK
jgi:hypothetical protein